MIKLFHGKNSFISFSEAKSLLDTLLHESPTTEELVIDAENTEMSQIIELYETQGMFCQKRVLFLKRLSHNKSYPSFIEYLSTIENSNNELLLWENSKIASNTKYFKQIMKSGEIFESPDLNKRTFSKWAKDTISKMDIKIKTDALNELSIRTNYDPERFIKELEKLNLLNPEITLDQVKISSTDTFESDIWKLIDSINDNNRVQTSIILENLLKNKVDPNYILAMMYRNIRLITQIKYLKNENKDNREISSILKLPPFTVPSLCKSAERLNESFIKKIYEKLTNLDFQIKIGEIDPEVGLTLISTLL